MTSEPSPIHLPHSRLSWLIATFFGIGHLRPGPGTWASVVTVLLWGVGGQALNPRWLVPVAIVVSVAVILIGIPSSTIVARASGQQGPGLELIDGDAGRMLALVWVQLQCE